jgi:hypothetical protein
VDVRGIVLDLEDIAAALQPQPVVLSAALEFEQPVRADVEADRGSILEEHHGGGTDRHRRGRLRNTLRIVLDVLRDQRPADERRLGRLDGFIGDWKHELTTTEEHGEPGKPTHEMSVSWPP